MLKLHLIGGTAIHDVVFERKVRDIWRVCELSVTYKVSPRYPHHTVLPTTKEISQSTSNHTGRFLFLLSNSKLKHDYDVLTSLPSQTSIDPCALLLKITNHEVLLHRPGSAHQHSSHGYGRARP